MVVTVNLVALKQLTLGWVDSLSDGAAIVNLGSLATFGWVEQVARIKAADSLTHAGVAGFCARNGITAENSYFFTKQVPIAFTPENRCAWRGRGIRMNAVSPSPVETRYCAILSEPWVSGSKKTCAS